MIRLIPLALASLFLAGCFSQQPAPMFDRNSGLQSRATPTQPSGPGYYTVKRGDTLYRIALEHGQDQRDIALWNNIVNPASIKEGLVLRVLPPGSSGANEAVQAKPIELGGAVEARSLDQPADTTDTSGLKREPKAGKEPYSDEAYARLNNPGANQAVVPKPVVVPAEQKPESHVAGPDDVAWIWPVPLKVTEPFNDSSNKGLNFSGKAGDPVLAAGEGKVVYAGAGLRGYGELVIVKHNAVYLSAYAHNRKILVKEGQQVSRGQKIAEMGNTDADSVKLHFEIRKQGKPVDPAQYLPKR